MTMAKDIGPSKRQTMRTQIESHSALDKLFNKNIWPGLTSLIIAYYHDNDKWKKLTLNQQRMLSNDKYNLNDYEPINGVFNMITNKLILRNMEMNQNLFKLKLDDRPKIAKLINYYNSLIANLHNFNMIIRTNFDKSSIDSLIAWVDKIMKLGYFNNTFMDQYFRYNHILDPKLTVINTTKVDSVTKNVTGLASKSTMKTKDKADKKTSSTKNKNKYKSKNTDKPYVDDNGCIPKTNIKFVADFCNAWQRYGSCPRGKSCWFHAGHKCSTCNSESHGAGDCVLG